jgi:hypothetical protein
MVSNKEHCRFREEDNTCVILRQTSSQLSESKCTQPDKNTETCHTAIWWQNPNLSPIDRGLVPPMGEI